MQAQAFVSERLLREKLGWEDERIQRALVNIYLMFAPDKRYILYFRNLIQKQDSQCLKKVIYLCKLAEDMVCS